MSKAVVIHHTLNTFGGETTVAIETMESLHDLGYEVELVTVQPPDLDAISRAYGRKISVEKTKSLLPFKLNYFGIYQKLLTLLTSMNIKDSDIVINTHGDALPYGISGIPYIIYLHFPTFLMTSAGYGSNKYQRSLFWKTYFKPYQLITHSLAKRAITRSTLILTNSEFSKEAIKKAYSNADPQVLYPAINVERFSGALRSFPNERRVLVISRFSPEKQIENAIKIAGMLRGKFKFQIVGSLMPANRWYFKALEQMVRSCGLREVVILTPNATNDELVAAMSKSILYLHTMVGEHFGVSIVEAMAGGLVPVVPAYGGCSEIVPPEYQYHTLEEAADLIVGIHYDRAARRQMHDMAMRFSPNRFKKGMKQYIEQARNSLVTPKKPSATAA